MIFTSNENGVKYGGIFKSKLIPYNEIRRIYITKDHTTITKLNGEELVANTGNTLSLSNDEFTGYVIKHNIEYVNQDEMEDGESPYTLEEAEERLKSACETAKIIGDPIVKRELGEEYELEFKAKGSEAMKSIYFYLKKNGCLVAMCDECKIDEDENEIESFDNFLGAFLVEWDCLSRSGKYCLGFEINHEDELKSYVEDSLEEFCEDYQTWS